jgi:hypothetical protein
MFLVLVMLSNGWAYRPFVSTDAAVADPYEVELEFGYVTFAHDTGDNTLTTPSLVLTVGVDLVAADTPARGSPVVWNRMKCCTPDVKRAVTRCEGEPYGSRQTRAPR